MTGESLDFVMESDWQPSAHEEGMMLYPAGYPFPVKLTGGVKGLDGEFTIVSTSPAMDQIVMDIRQANNTCILTIPTAAGGLRYGIVFDPAQDVKGVTKFSQMLWQWITVFTIRYFQVSGVPQMVIVGGSKIVGSATA